MLVFTNVKMKNKKRIINTLSLYVFQITGRYGLSKIKNWFFETWNEPDLHGYNLLNFNFNGIKIVL